MTQAFSFDIATRADAQALATALCTSFTGSSPPLGSTVTWATTCPVMSATPAVTPSGPTSNPAT